ncbi:MAG: cupin domain-containing protein [Nakamurella sp.]
MGSIPTPPLPDHSQAMTLLVVVPPGSAGSPPHRHTGPAFGFVIEGEMVFECRRTRRTQVPPRTTSHRHLVGNQGRDGVDPSPPRRRGPVGLPFATSRLPNAPTARKDPTR